MQKWRYVCLAAFSLLLASCDLPVVSENAGPQHASLPSTPVVAKSAPTADNNADLGAPGVLVPADGDTAQFDCPMTKPPRPPFVPPPPYPQTARSSEAFWYGTNGLWTEIPMDGKWSGLPLNPDGYTQKIFWWREGYSWTEDPEPDLKVTGRRLDAPAPPLITSQATNAYAEDIGSAMLVGVDFPAPGCWEITGKIADNTLTFVVLVEP